MQEIYYGTADGWQKLDSITEVELTPDEETEEELKKRFLSPDSIEFSGTLDTERTERIAKQIVFGGDRGRYNGYILKRDGYLSPENAWIEDK